LVRVVEGTLKVPTVEVVRHGIGNEVHRAIFQNRSARPFLLEGHLTLGSNFPLKLIKLRNDLVDLGGELGGGIEVTDGNRTGWIVQSRRV
jgi:hypothetical protein